MQTVYPEAYFLGSTTSRTPIGLVCMLFIATAHVSMLLSQVLLQMCLTIPEKTWNNQLLIGLCKLARLFTIMWILEQVSFKYSFSEHPHVWCSTVLWIISVYPKACEGIWLFLLSYQQLMLWQHQPFNGLLHSPMVQVCVQVTPVAQMPLVHKEAKWKLLCKLRSLVSHML